MCHESEVLTEGFTNSRFICIFFYSFQAVLEAEGVMLEAILCTHKHW